MRARAIHRLAEAVEVASPAAEAVAVVVAAGKTSPPKVMQ